MSTCAEKRAALLRTPVDLLYLAPDCCGNVFGSSPCTATGTPCYNTYQTCVDRANYNVASTPMLFSSAQVPALWPHEFLNPSGEVEVPLILPYLLALDYLPTEIKDTLTINARIKAKVFDEPWQDVGTDPYLSLRASVNASTFWRKWLARNHNYTGRYAMVLHGFRGVHITDYQGGFIGKISAISYNKGSVEIELQDTLKDLDAIEIPAKTTTKLIVDISASAESATLNDTEGHSLTDGYFRIDDEIIKYATLSATTHVASGLVRGAFGTTAAAHSVDSPVQACRYFAPGNPFDHLLDMLENDAGILSGLIDTPAFASCKASPGDEGDISTIVSEPTKLSQLFYEIVDLIDCRVWVNESMLITICHNMVNTPTLTYIPVTDETEFVLDSISIDMNEGSRITRVIAYWNWDFVSEEEKPLAYGQRIIVRDATAEGANEYGDKVEKVWWCRWLYLWDAPEEEIARTMQTYAARYLAHRRDAQPIIKGKLEIKDETIAVGNMLSIATSHIVNADGTPATGVYMVSRKQKQRDGKIDIQAIKSLGGSKRYLIIAPADYAGLTYSTATAEQQRYGGICGTDNKMLNGDEGFRIY